MCEVAEAEYAVDIGGGETLACGPCVDGAEDVTRADCYAIPPSPGPASWLAAQTSDEGRAAVEGAR